MSLQINFNGKTYNNLDEMPPEARQAYQQAMSMFADQNGNGLPDIFDNLAQGQAPGAATPPLNVFSTTTSTQILYNGQTYASLDAMPAEARRAYQQAMGTLDQNRNGVPDAAEAAGFQAGAANVKPRQPTANRLTPHPYTPQGVDLDAPAARARKRRIAMLVAFVVLDLIILASVLIAVFGRS